MVFNEFESTNQIVWFGPDDHHCTEPLYLVVRPGQCIWTLEKVDKANFLRENWRLIFKIFLNSSSRPLSLLYGSYECDFRSSNNKHLWWTRRDAWHAVRHSLSKWSTLNANWHLVIGKVVSLVSSWHFNSMRTTRNTFMTGLNRRSLPWRKVIMQIIFKSLANLERRQNQIFVIKLDLWSNMKPKPDQA